MSKIQVNEIVNHFDNGAPDCPKGLTVTGVSTFSGDVSIGGTLTYEDVTNVDSIGIITAQSGVEVGPKTGIGITLNANGSAVFTGSISGQSAVTNSWFQTATSLYSTNYVWSAKNSSTNTWHSGLQTDGDLVLGNVVNNPNISLKGSDGSGTFTTGVQIGQTTASVSAPGGYLYATRYLDASNVGSAALCSEASGELYGVQIINREGGGATEVASIKMDGSATFAGTVQAGRNSSSGSEAGIFLHNAGFVAAARDSATDAVWRSFTAGNSNETISMTAGGSATFDGVATAQGISARAPGTTDSTQKLWTGKNALGNVQTSNIYADGTATFDGDVTSGSNPTGGAGTGARLRSIGIFYACRASTGNSVFAGYLEGTANPTSQIFAGGGATFSGAVSKGSGSFKIDHPLPAKKDTHHLVHSFIEGPQADLIYRGVVDLVDGTATVNVDTAGRMTEGTFVALCTNVSCFTSNESDWTAVKGSVTGNVLTISAQDNTSTATVSWMVVGERKDQHMIDTEWTDENGRVITEPLKS